MKKEKVLQNASRRKLLIQTPIAFLGLMAFMKGQARGSMLQTGNYRRRIDPDSCVSCGACVEVCPTAAIQTTSGSYTVNPNLCIGCGACEPECPVDAIEQGTLIVVPTVNIEECVACSACAAACPTNAINVGSAAVITLSLCSGCRDCVPVCPVACIS
jgi:formate hydrogenlyase subunit 6/NADH:ubiquinone oxidoreductase subunit I